MPGVQVEAIRGDVRGDRLWWLAVALALGMGLLLRLWFVGHPMPSDDDADVYTELADNLFHHGTYGLVTDGVIDPTLIRVPGYPVFLGLMFGLFGAGNVKAVMLVQIAAELLGCWLIASFVRKAWSTRAGMVAIFLAALCPFTAAYSAMVLTECLSVFAVALGLWAYGRVLGAQREGRVDRWAVALAAMACAMAMLLRPDGALLTMAMLAAIVWSAARQRQVRRGLRTAVACGLVAALPLAPWAVRNWRTFGVVQPLAPRRVNDPGEYVTYGFYRWMGTWSVDVVSTGSVFWNVGTDAIDIGDLPSRAFDSAGQYAETAELLREYNAHRTILPELDAKFGALASERVRAHPVECLVWVPVLRVVDMLLRPRTETFGMDADWWRFDRHGAESAEAVGLGLMNVVLVVAAGWGMVRAWRDSEDGSWVLLPVVYVALRCALLSTMENSEPRYTLEMFPMLIACAACGLAGARGGRGEAMGAAAEVPITSGR